MREVLLETSTAPVGRGRRRSWRGGGGANERALAQWPPRWRRLLKSKGDAPEDYTEFDRTVRGMLNRISSQNACRILPLEPSLRGAEMGDCPPWWAARFSALMLSSYLQVISTNRHARGLSLASSDNVLPGYLDAITPLLIRSPRLVTALMARFARLLRLDELCWPRTRLVLLAARRGEESDPASLPPHDIGRLPADLIRGRILNFLVPPRARAVEGFFDDLETLYGAQSWDGEKDVVAVLAHLIMFSPPVLWPRLSAFSFSLAEAALSVDIAAAAIGADCGGPGKSATAKARQLYIAASVLAVIAQRLKQDQIQKRRCTGDVGTMRRLTEQLRSSADPSSLRSRDVPQFVTCRIQAALEGLAA